MTTPPINVPTGGAQSLLAALGGRFDQWWFSDGLTPDAVSAAVGQQLAPGPVLHSGHQRLQAVVEFAGQPYPVRLRWEPDGELALVELSQPDVDPSWDAVLAALGEPDVIYPHGRGPVPGGDQRCYFDRGLTIFDSAGLGYQAVWLYPPMSADDYPGRTGAFDPINRAR